MSNAAEVVSSTEEESLMRVRAELSEQLNAHESERTPKCLYWDLYWTQSCLRMFLEHLELTNPQTHLLLRDINLVLRRFFDEAFIFEKPYRIDPRLGVEVVQHLHDRVAHLDRESETHQFEFEGSEHQVSIWDTYTHVRSAFDKYKEDLYQLITDIGRFVDTGLEPTRRLAETPLPKFGTNIEKDLFLQLQKEPKFITGEDLAAKVGCSPNSVTPIKKKWLKAGYIEMKGGPKEGFRLKAMYLSTKNRKSQSQNE